MRNDKKKIIKVIFNIKGRTKYIEKYLNMIKKNYKFNYCNRGDET